MRAVPELNAEGHGRHSCRPQPSITIYEFLFYLKWFLKKSVGTATTHNTLLWLPASSPP